MAMSVLRAEFPDFEALRGFSIFTLAKERRLTTSGREIESAVTEVFATNIARVAKLADVDVHEFRNEYFEILPRAREHFITTSCSNITRLPANYGAGLLGALASRDREPCFVRVLGGQIVVGAQLAAGGASAGSSRV